MSATSQERGGEGEFVAMMALLQALQALAIDSMLPALGVIAGELGAPSANSRQLVIGMFLIGSGLGSLVPGVLADRYGRRPVLFVCLVAYCLLNLASALVSDFTALLALRFAAGFATAGMVVLPAAIIRDRFEGDRMARLQSLVSMVFMVVPLLAPALGQGVLLFAGWRWIFGIMAAMSAAMLVWSGLRLPETLRDGNRQPIRPGVIAANLSAVLAERTSLCCILAMSATSAMFFTFLSTSQQLIVDHFRAESLFPLVFAVLVGSLTVSHFFNSRLVLTFGARRVSQTALLAYLAVGAFNVWLAWDGRVSLLQFTLATTAGICLTGFMSANFQAIALQPFGRAAGAAASAAQFLRMVIGAMAGVLIARAYDGTALPLAMTMLLTGSVSLLFVLIAEKGRMFRRLNPPQAAA